MAPFQRIIWERKMLGLFTSSNVLNFHFWFYEVWQIWKRGVFEFFMFSFQNFLISSLLLIFSFGKSENVFLAFSKILVLFSEIENENSPDNIFLLSLFILEMKTGNKKSNCLNGPLFSGIMNL